MWIADAEHGYEGRAIRRIAFLERDGEVRFCERWGFDEAVF